MQSESPPAGRPATPLDALPALLAAALEHLRTNSAEGLRVEPSVQERLDNDWPRVVQVMKLLQQKLQGVAGVQAFNISRDQGEVTAKVQGPSRRGYLILSRRHPTQRAAATDKVWLSDLGGQEAGFSDAGEAMQDFTRRILALLA